MKKFLIVGILIISILVAGCSNTNAPLQQPVVDATVSPTTESCGNIHSYGNGVIFFGCTDDVFMRSLDNYIVKHPNITITSVSPVPIQYTYNGLNGYIVTVRRIDGDNTSPYL